MNKDKENNGKLVEESEQKDVRTDSKNTPTDSQQAGGAQADKQAGGTQADKQAGGDKGTQAGGTQADKQAGSGKGTQTGGEGESKNYTLMFIALGCLVVGVVVLVLSFIIAGWQTKLLIVSMIFALACASLLNGQKRRAYSNACKVLQILSYAVMIGCVAIIVIQRMM